MRKIKEALDSDQQTRIYDLEKDIIDIRTTMLDAESDQKERLKGEIEDLQARIQGIKDSAE